MGSFLCGDGLRGAWLAAVGCLFFLPGCPSTDPEPGDLPPPVPGDTCDPGAQRCSTTSDKSYEVCRADGRGWFEKSCPTGSACDPTTGACASVSEGCEPGTARCTGSPGTAARSVCSPDGAGWSSEPCSGSLVCDSATGDCAQPVCTAGESRCDGGPADPDRSTCSPDRLSFVSTPCPSSTVCVPTSGGSKCVSRTCTPGSKQCNGDFTQVLVCDATGTLLEVDTACTDDEACSGGTCKDSSTPLGEVVRVKGDGATLPMSPGSYAVAVVHTDASSDDLVDYPLSISGAATDPTSLVARATPPRRFPARLSGTAAMLARRPATKPEPHAPMPLPGPVPQDTGDRVFHVPDYDAGGAATLARTAKLRASGQHVQLWEDQTSSPPGSQLPDATLSDLLQRLDQAVLPRAKAMVGEPTDVDANGKVDILFTDVIPAAVAAFSYPSATLFAPGTFPVTYDHGEVVYAQGVDATIPTWETATLMSHEVAQLIYLGRRLSPFLSDPATVPAWVDADVYAVEGLASVVMGWSGQSWAWPAVAALEHPEEMSLWRLMAPGYIKEPSANLASYGFGALVQEYLFDQAGAMVVKGGGSVIEDAGGLAYLEAFASSESGWDRLRPLDGRALSEWYVDFAAALLLVGLEGKTATTTSANERYWFAETVEDTGFGGSIGPTLRWEHVRDATETGPILRPVAWSERPAQLRRGGVSWVAVNVGESGATMNVSDASATVVVVRHLP